MKDLRKRLFELLDTLDNCGSADVGPDSNHAGSSSPTNENLEKKFGPGRKIAPNAPFVKATPLAFPVVEVNYALRERVPEPIGLIRRAVLRAVIEFGPCDSKFIDGLLGLGTDIVERTLVEMAKSISDLIQTGSEYAAGPKCSKILQGDSFLRHVTHERKFLVNGVTDSLLPVEFWRKHNGLRLFPDPDNPNGPMCTESGDRTTFKAKISDRASTGRDHLQQLIRDGDAKLRARFGLPLGACELGEGPPAMRVAWVVGFLLVRSDNSIELMTARRDPVRLLEGIDNPKEYLRHVCQGVKSWNLNVGAPTQPTGKWVDRWPEGTKFVPGRSHGEVMASLNEPKRLLRFDSETDSRDKNARFLLEQSRDWNAGTLKIYRIIPGDLETAKTTALLRGIRELRFMLRPIEPSLNPRPPINLADWWFKWQIAFGIQEGLKLPDNFVTLDELIKVTDNVKDTDFQDKLEWILR